MINKKSVEWNNSYENKDNFVFYPHEDVIRFISKYIKKRVGLNSFKNKFNSSNSPKILDFGCGIGRHILLLNDFGLDGYGFDLSENAIQTAKTNFNKLALNKLVEKVIVADITNLPYGNDMFDFMLSHGVIDSMSFNIAKLGFKELHRVIKKNGLVYFDIIDTEDSSFENTKEYDQIVNTDHEKGTVQSYFDRARIEELIKNKFEIIEIYKIKRIDCLDAKSIISRFHVIIKKI